MVECVTLIYYIVKKTVTHPTIKINIKISEQTFGMWSSNVEPQSPTVLNMLKLINLKKYCRIKSCE